MSLPLCAYVSNHGTVNLMHCLANHRNNCCQNDAHQSLQVPEPTGCKFQKSSEARTPAPFPDLQHSNSSVLLEMMALIAFDVTIRFSVGELALGNHAAAQTQQHSKDHAEPKCV